MTTRRDVIKYAALGLVGLGAGVARAGAPLPIKSDFPLADLEHRTFQWFWDNGNPANGLIPDRAPSKSFCSIASVGFGLTAYTIAATRGWITRAQARDRTLTTLRFFANAKQGKNASGVTGYKGFFYHFIDMATGQRFQTTELSSIDTVLLLAGVLNAGQYYDHADPAEAEIRRLATKINNAVDWKWMLDRGPFISMGWTPENGFIPSQWDRYNECTLLYLLALGSPTHPVPPAIWTRWTATWNITWGDHWGERHIAFPPLFGHQYSHVWVDFRGIRDPWLRAHDLDLFENSRRAVRAQRNYAIANPGGWAGYGPDVWGLSACDGPGDFNVKLGGRTRNFFSYSARGPGDRDDGTLAPTAVAASIAFEPALVLSALEEMSERYGAGIVTKYGYVDSYNPSLASLAPNTKLSNGRLIHGFGWVDTDYLGIDQGPIVAMIANHRDEAVWKAMRGCRPLIDGLKRAGFTGGWLDNA